MPYNDISDLPESVQDALPEKAQEIFLAAFNNAWEQYDSADKRKGDSSREEAAFKVAWSAVKKKYEKKGDTWKKR